MNARVTFDPDVKAIYIQFSEAFVHETIPLAKGVFLDVDAAGQAVGFEILNADSSLLARLPASLDPVDLAVLLRGSAA